MYKSDRVRPELQQVGRRRPEVGLHVRLAGALCRGQGVALRVEKAPGPVLVSGTPRIQGDLKLPRDASCDSKGGRNLCVVVTLA